MSRIITTVLAIGALLCSMLLSYTASISINPTQNIITEAKNKPNTIKKAKLKLGYTHPKFAIEINQDQQQAILKSLKKWKLDLPINNTFTITSWANLKTDTGDKSSQLSKKNKLTPNSIVVYMWATNNNPDWKVGKVPTEEESESGDPRFVRTEFNVLLKQDKNGKWKATIEQDNELKTESTEVVENQQDIQIHQDLFGTNREINKFTDTQEVVVDEDGCDNSNSSVSSSVSSNTSSVAISSSSSSSCSSSNQSSSVVSSSLNSNSSQSTNSSSNANSVSSSVSSLVSISTQSSNSSTSSLVSSNTSSVIGQSSNNSNSTTTSSKSSWLNSILSFGSVQASAGEYDYSWPWTQNETWIVGQKGWHNYSEFGGIGIYGSALDLMAPCGSNCDGKEILVKAPITGTTTRACNDINNSMVVIGRMAILHMDNNWIVGNGVSVKKSDIIGKVQTKNNGYFGDPQPTGSFCGVSYGAHLHIKMLDDNMTIDGAKLSYASNYTNYSFTSQNTPPSAATGFQIAK